MKETDGLLGDWWFSIGKWQLPAVFITLTVFYAMRHFIDGNNAGAALVVVLVLALFTVIFCGFMLGAAATAFSVTLSAIAVALAVAIFNINEPGTAGGLVVAVLALSFAFFAVGLYTELDFKDTGMKKSAIYIFCTSEFIVTLLPILGTMRGWW
ncbi:MAG: hypothetical protein V1867_00485 [Candidatus Falkowbacteria bacterium]